MTKTEKRNYWQSHIEAWQRGASSQKAYCESQGISLASFGYWRKRLADQENPPSNKLVAVGSTSMPTIIRMHLPSGIVLDVPAGTLAAVLPVVYKAMRVGGDA